MPLPGQNLCYHVVGTYDGPALKACASATEPDEWRVRQEQAGPLRPLPGLDDWFPVLITAVSSTGWIAWPHLLSSGGLYGLNGLDTEVSWVVFTERNPDGEWGLPFQAADGGQVRLLDVTNLVSTTILGLPTGPASVEFLGPTSDGEFVLMVVSAPDLASTDDDDVHEEVRMESDLYLIDLTTATAHPLGADVGGALSPDADALATTTLLSATTAGSLSVGPVDGPLVGIGPVFGTWLTP